VHISFVRSIAMDSWPEQQLQLMKQGGNRACNEYLQKHGIAPRTPIKQKYESSAAQLYKLVLKARVEGTPEPTELPPPQKRQPYVSKSAPASGNGSSSMGQQPMSQDANGMERLMGETDQQYIARQTRLREEAKARMAAKFGGSGMGGGSGSGMQGIGSDPSYNPNGGYGGGGGGGDLDVNAVISGFGSMLGSAVHSAKSLADERTVNSLKSSGASFWGGLTSSVSQIASTIAAPDDAGMDGLSELQRQAHAQASTRSAGGSNSKYAGFGSDSMTTMNGSSSNSNSNYNNNNARTSSGNSMGSANNNGGGGGLQEAPGLPGEDRNGVGRLSGETDEQYVVRQTRLRDEARARMAAKFGGAAALGGVGSSSTSSPPAIASAPGSGNRLATTTGPQSAPGSGNAPKLNPSAFPRPKTPPKKVMNSTDFFSSFGE